MGLGQTLMATLFLVLLTFAVVNANRMMVDRTETYLEMEAIKQATYYANSLLDEISLKKFDSNFDEFNYPYQETFEFSAPGWSWPGTEWGPSDAAKNNVNPNGIADTVNNTRSYKSIRGSSSNYFDDVDDYEGYIREVNTGYLKGFKLKSLVRYTSNPLDSTIDISFNTGQTKVKRAYVFIWNEDYMSDTLVFFTHTSY